MHQVNISAVMDDYIPRFQGGVACVESVSVSVADVADQTAQDCFRTAATLCPYQYYLGVSENREHP